MFVQHESALAPGCVYSRREHFPASAWTGLSQAGGPAAPLAVTHRSDRQVSPRWIRGLCHTTSPDRKMDLILHLHQNKTKAKTIKMSFSQKH